VVDVSGLMPFAEIVQICTILTLVAGAALARSVEVALGAVSEAKARSLAEAGLWGADTLLRWCNSPSKVWALLAIAQAACVGGAAVSAVDLVRLRYSGPSFWLVWGLGAVLLAIFWHVFPAALARSHALFWSRCMIGPLHVLAAALWPLTSLLAVLPRIFWRWSGSLPLHGAWKADELADMVVAARNKGIGAADKELLLSIIEFSDTTIREIMVPRTEMVALPLAATDQELRHTVIEGGHSRIPVFEETVDNVLGILHVKDLFRASIRAQSGVPAEGLAIEMTTLRPAFYVPEVMQISELLRDFQRRKTHMAIVVDEYGGTAGVVTLEDIIEEIVGEIQDEYDVEEKQFRVVAEGKIIADGRVGVNDLEEVLGIRFPEDASFETLAGFLMLEIGFLPQKGAVLNWNGLRFTVKEANEKRVGTVEIVTLPLEQ